MGRRVCWVAVLVCGLCGGLRWVWGECGLGSGWFVVCVLGGLCVGCVVCTGSVGRLSVL